MPGSVPASVVQAIGQAMRPSRMYCETPPGIAMTLYSRFVALTAGLVKPSTLI